MNAEGRPDLTAAILAPPVLLLVWACLLGGCAVSSSASGHAVAYDRSSTVHRARYAGDYSV